MKRYVSGLISGLLGVVGSSQVLADTGSNGYYYGDHHMMWGNWFMGPIMMVFMVVIIVVAVILVMKMFGIGSNDGPGDPATVSALAILNERFARGEIDKTEYEERKSTLLS